MKKFLSFLFIFILSIISYSQLDTKHWFAPMVDGVGNPNNYQRLYLSTNREIPFDVKIYNNNNLIETITISKGKPGVYDIPRHYIITTSFPFTTNNNLFTPTKMGLYLEGDYSYFANLRFSTFNHAEIITSKGVAGTGNLFYTVLAPTTVYNQILNFMTSILATEDNTIVKISKFDSTINFSDNIYRNEFNITLNKGESYIIEGKGDKNYGGTFIGAKIESNKPVSVTNGNFNGQYAGDYPNSSDILMDQNVPVNQLGKEFILVKGNGDINQNVEGAIVVATEDNTQIYVNDNSTPLTTIKEGEYYVINDQNYINEGNDHYNLYVKTSKNAYVFQLLAGSSGENAHATGGMNFIPALSCFLPKSINEIGLIDQNRIYSNNNMFGIDNIPTKLNIITEKNAKITVNDATPNKNYGPFNLKGNNNWVTYSLPNQKGNITILSDKSVTAGIIAGSDAAGYGGFFAGMPTQPSIVKAGCFPNATLSVTPEIYESYQWYLNGVAIKDATKSFYKPTKLGYYTVEVVIGSCTPLKTEPFKLTTCAIESELNYKACKASFDIEPKFTKSSQKIDYSSISILKESSKGKVIIDTTTGQITYTPNNGATGEDIFQYTFHGTNEFEDSEIVTVKILLEQLKIKNDTLYTCNINGNGVFNLSLAEVTYNTNTSKKYYVTRIDAENKTNEIKDFEQYNSANNQKVFVSITNEGGCEDIAEITLEFYPLPIIDLTKYETKYCGNEINVDLDYITSQIILNRDLFTISYYSNSTDALLGNTNNLPSNNTFTTNTTVYVRIDSKNGCDFIIKELNFSFAEKVPLISNNLSFEECDEDFDNISFIDLSQYISNFTSDGNIQISYHKNIEDAYSNINSISPKQEVNQTKTIYIRFSLPNLCPNIGSITINIKTPLRSKTLEDIIICPNTTTILDPGVYKNYLWNTNETSQSIKASKGDFWVDLTSENNCIYRHNVKVSNFELPTINSIQTINDKAVINIQGGNSPYKYSLDGKSWQTSNTFINLENGNYTVYVISADNCTPVKKDFTIFKINNFISPNGDGKNDKWVVKFNGHKDVIIQIFDRFNKTIINTKANDEFIWDGKHNGFTLPSDSYWYRIKLNEKEILNGYITIKNK